jgi:hypothetical protein
MNWPALGCVYSIDRLASASRSTVLINHALSIQRAVAYGGSEVLERDQWSRDCHQNISGRCSVVIVVHQTIAACQGQILQAVENDLHIEVVLSRSEGRAGAADRPAI